MRSAIALIACLALLALVNFSIRGKERQLADGSVVYLELAPVDPRSLMQGDYMALRFKMEDGALLAGRELLLRYRVRNGELKFATNAFFFQEGTARRYERARYGEFRVAPDGELLLTGLRGAELQPL